MTSSGILLDKVLVSMTRKGSNPHIYVGPATLFAVALLAAGQVSWISPFSLRNFFLDVFRSRAHPSLQRLLAKLFVKVSYNGKFRCVFSLLVRYFSVIITITAACRPSPHYATDRDHPFYGRGRRRRTLRSRHSPCCLAGCAIHRPALCHLPTTLLHRQQSDHVRTEISANGSSL